MKSLFAIGLASFYGLSIRILFGLFASLMGIMSITFLVLVPLIIGYLTVILLPKRKANNSTSAFFIPWLTSFAILIITILINIEGIICWIMIYPFFSILAGLGGVIAYTIRKKKTNDAEGSDWEGPSTLNVSLLIFIPVFLGLVEGDKTLTPEEFTVSKTITILASTKDVWYTLRNINDIKADESKASFANSMGFPKHLRTTLDTFSVGGKRKAIYEKGLYFDETITRLEKEELLVLDIKTDPTKIPPTVMDEHIVIGGKHVDILQDIYKIEKLSNTSCRLTLSSRFYINTPFNWYASIWAKYLMSDILHSEIDLIKQRVISK